MKEKKEVCLLDRKEKVLCIFWAAGVTALVDFLFYGTLWVMLLTPVTAGFLMKRRKILLEKRRKKRMTKQFGDMMTSLCVALRAGYSMENALAECARDLEKLHGEEAELVAELKYIRNQMQISIPVEKLLSQLGELSRCGGYSKFCKCVCNCEADRRKSGAGAAQYSGPPSG